MYLERVLLFQIAKMYRFGTCVFMIAIESDFKSKYTWNTNLGSEMNGRILGPQLGQTRNFGLGHGQVGKPRTRTDAIQKFTWNS